MVVSDRTSMDLAGRRVWVAGHNGMVGGALVRALVKENCSLLTVDRSNVDLRRQREVEQWMRLEEPEIVFLSAAKVGGILANDTYPAEFLYDNLLIEANVIEAARLVGVQKLLFLGSSCIYPKFAPQPIQEDALLTGPLESTNEWYAIAKISGLKLVQAYRKQYGCDFISAMPANLYGPNDNFDLTTSHVLPALLRKFHEAKTHGQPVVSIWGTGSPRREFMHVDDCAEALIFLMKNYSADGHVNVGTGFDITITELATLVASVVGFHGTVSYDHKKPDGTPRKLLDVSRLHSLGWNTNIGLREGIAQTYRWYIQHHA